MFRTPDGTVTWVESQKNGAKITASCIHTDGKTVKLRATNMPHLFKYFSSQETY